MIRVEELELDGWEKEGFYGVSTYWKKTINGFHYILSIDEQKEKTNWFDWYVHVDTPDFCTVATFEVDSLKDISIISSIYRKK